MSKNPSPDATTKPVQPYAGTDLQPLPSAEELAVAIENFSKYFRAETLVTETDLRVDVANSLYRTVLGDETVDTVTYETHLRGDFAEMAGERDRTADSYERSTDNTETLVIDGSCTETVDGRMTVRAALSAESLVGGTYTNAITGAYLRLAAWCDQMAWGGWLEADLVRSEIAGMMIRSHVAYAHAAVARISCAGRIVDDLSYRLEHFDLFVPCHTVYNSVGVPGSGVIVET